MPQHARKIKPPRTLMVPFAMGRPLGSPLDAEFQKQVLRAAFATLNEAAPGPVLHEFEQDAPPATSGDAEPWACPVSFTKKREPDAGLETLVAEEIQLLTPWFDKGVSARGYTSTGTSGMSITQVNRFLNEFLTCDPPRQSPDQSLPLGDCFKLAVEDLKAFYNESAIAQPGNASAEEVADWLWDDTCSGRLIRELRTVCADHPDSLVKIVAQFTLVPAARV